MSTFIQEQEFKGIDYSQERLSGKEYLDCRFMDCNFSGLDLGGIEFENCEFTGCDLSLVKLNRSAFREVIFSNCKMFGLHFQDCNDFLLSMDFRNCQLNLSSFFRGKAKGFRFKACLLQEVDFEEADLAGVSFDACDLAGAIFDQCNLEKCDFRTAINYQIDPNTNRISKAKFSRDGLQGLLSGFDIEIS